MQLSPTAPVALLLRAHHGEGGAQVLNGPMEVPGGAWIVQARDPQGAAFAMVSANK